MKFRKEFDSKMILLNLVWFIFFLLTALVSVFWIIPSDIKVEALTNASRIMNSIFAALVTSMTFILTVTSNLYTPRLVKVFIINKIIITGLVLIVITNLSFILCGIFSPLSPWFPYLTKFTFFLSCMGLAGTIPFFYYIISFIRPVYFLPKLEKTIREGLSKLEDGKIVRKNYVQVVENWDVITNIALTAAKRDDRQLVRLALRMLDDSLISLLLNFSNMKSPWRSHYPMFIAGLTKESCLFLKENFLWPEAYVLYKKLHILKSIQAEQNEVVVDSCSNLHKTLRISSEKDKSYLIEMHLMLMNTLMRISVEKKNAERFQSLSYHYLLNIEILCSKPSYVAEILASWRYYGKKAKNSGMLIALETVYHDCGQLLIRLGKVDETMSIIILKEFIIDLWNEGFADKDDHLKLTCWKVTVKTYWEAKTLKLNSLADEIHVLFLQDKRKHKKIIKELSSFNSILNWELGERLLSFDYVSQDLIERSKKYFE